MEITILLDHDLEGYDVFLIASLAETGWDQLLKITFKRLRDFHLPTITRTRRFGASHRRAKC